MQTKGFKKINLLFLDLFKVLNEVVGILDEPVAQLVFNLFINDDQLSNIREHYNIKLINKIKTQEKKTNGSINFGKRVR